ncbi:MAG: MFS transporter [Clostridia bacterium]|nr:MFS transporter [Clostridia bacterium]
MKLNYRRTLLVGFAFFLICAFWQAYDNIVPKILTDKFGLPQVWSGVIMALDNVFAVILLPVFGAVSDRHNGRLGRRTPFILGGTLAAAMLFVALSLADNMQLSSIADSVPDVADTEARLDAAAKATAENPTALILFMVILLFVLLSMSVSRSPAVALMPDVTPKPLRSKANAIINLMGSVGGILILVLGILFGTGKAENALMSYTGFFTVVALIMLAALAVFMLTVREKDWAREADEINAGLSDEPQPQTGDKPGLTRAERRSLLFILASVVLWYMGYNAVTSKYSVYAGDVLGLDYNLTLIIAQAAAIVSYIPVGALSQKLGRRKMILAGVIMLGAAFGFASFMRAGSNIWVMNALFALAGIGWATINVNSYPMAVELASAGDVGRYTGYYYTASMAAQIITPVLSGVFLTAIGMETLFPYAAIFVAGAFVTMLFVRHGDTKPVGKGSVLEHLDVE